MEDGRSGFAPARFGPHRIAALPDHEASSDARSSRRRIARVSLLIPARDSPTPRRIASGVALLAASLLFAPPVPAGSEPEPGPSLPETSLAGEGGRRTAAEPRLVLRAPRQLRLRQRMPGEMRRPSLDVRVSARLENLEDAENPEDYYCLEEVWDWDDDTESVYEPDCDPYEPGADIETYFFNSHRFSLPGTYRVYLRLQRSGETVIAGNVSVRIAN